MIISKPPSPWHVADTPNVRLVYSRHLPVWAKMPAGILMPAASQSFSWSQLSSGSVFAPEFPRVVVILFNWAFGALVLLAVLQLVIDVGALLTMLLVRREVIREPDALRYTIAGLATVLTRIGVVNALRLPPIKDVTVAIRNPPPSFGGYRVVQLTDLHIGRLFTSDWAQAETDFRRRFRY